MLSRICLAWSRFALSAWVGAAVLFVINGVAQVTFPGFESIVRDQMTLIRFPNYYICGFSLVGSSLLALLVISALKRGACPAALKCGCTRTPVLLTLLALIVMGIDYLWVYLPLAAMITPPGSPRTPQFITLHKASMYINLVHVGLSLAAAWILCWPGTSDVLRQQTSPAPEGISSAGA